jgi:hypothetical protein
MLARGYRGDARTLERFAFGPRELAAAAACAVAVAAMLGGDRLLGG